MLTNLNNVPVITSINIEAVKPMTTKHFWLHLTSEGIGTPIYIPIIIIRGKSDNKIVGVTAVIHGNELNGISVVQKLVRTIDPKKLDGVLICVPVSNIPAFLHQQRCFPDEKDLNRIMPGNQLGNESELYAYRLISRVINEFDYLIDLHTASIGNANSFYVLGNMNVSKVTHMAWLQNPQIIVHDDSRGTLCKAAENLGIHAITVNVGDLDQFQKQGVSSALNGILNMLVCFNMLEGEVHEAADSIIECDSSVWLHTDQGGLLEVYPDLAEPIKKGQLIAKVSNIFGDPIAEYFAPEDGIIIGKNTNLFNPANSEILHLGLGF